MLPLTSPPIALFYGRYLCAFGCSLLWPLFVHLPFWVLSFVATICAFALLGTLFCGRYLCVHLCFWVLSFMVTICAFALLCAPFCGHYLCICPFGCFLLWTLRMCASALLGALFGLVLSCYSFPFSHFHSM